jgi:hypothetical protein
VLAATFTNEEGLTFVDNSAPVIMKSLKAFQDEDMRRQQWEQFEERLNQFGERLEMRLCMVFHLVCMFVKGLAMSLAWLPAGCTCLFVFVYGRGI